jgi:cell division protein FtsQ
LQSVIHSQPPTFHDWHDEARFFRASRDSVSRTARAMLAAARQTPENETLRWLERHANLFSRLGLVATLMFYALTAAYGVTLSGRWDEVRHDAMITANETALAAGLGIAKVNIQGRTNVTDEQIYDALGAREGVSIFAFDTASARDRLLQYGWIREARVMRLLPATLVVELEERTPFAIWREGGESVAIDASGRVLGKAEATAFPLLPVVSGPGAASPAREIVEEIRVLPELAGRIRDIERVAGRRWDLLLDTGLRAKLPAGHAKAALADLNEMIAKNPTALYEISEIDLRVGTQFTLRLKDASEEGRKKFLSWFAKARGGREDTL